MHIYLYVKYYFAVSTSCTIPAWINRSERLRVLCTSNISPRKDTLTTLVRLTLACAFIFALGSPGFPQAPAPAPATPTAPAAPKAPAVPKVPKAMDAATKALAKECSAKADVQGLHGKA